MAQVIEARQDFVEVIEAELATAFASITRSGLTATLHYVVRAGAATQGDEDHVPAIRQRHRPTTRAGSLTPSGSPAACGSWPRSFPAHAEQPGLGRRQRQVARAR
jgi:hypothetical protein